MVDGRARSHAHRRHPYPWNESLGRIRYVARCPYSLSDPKSSSPQIDSCRGVTTDLQYRAQSSACVAFIGDAESCSRFDKVSIECGISLIYQVPTLSDPTVSHPSRINLAAAFAGIPKGTLYKGERLVKTDLCMLYFTSGTTGQPKQVLLESEWAQGHIVSGLWCRLTKGTYFSNSVDLGTHSSSPCPSF